MGTGRPGSGTPPRASDFAHHVLLVEECPLRGQQAQPRGLRRSMPGGEAAAPVTWPSLPPMADTCHWLSNIQLHFAVCPLLSLGCFLGGRCGLSPSPKRPDSPSPHAAAGQTRDMGPATRRPSCVTHSGVSACSTGTAGGQTRSVELGPTVSAACSSLRAWDILGSRSQSNPSSPASCQFWECPKSSK